MAADSASWSKAFKLYADVDFTGTTLATFTSVGNSTTAFTGSLDGNGFMLKNLSVTGTTEELAIFGKTNSAVTIQNLTLQNISLTSDARMAGLILDHGAGGVLTLDHISVDGLTLTTTFGDDNGGLVGHAQSSVSATHITLNNLSFSNSTSNSTNWGGILGSSSASISVSDVTGSSIQNLGGLNDHVGGLVGMIDLNADFTDVRLTGLNLSLGDFGGGVAYCVQGSASFNRVHVTGSVTSAVGAGGLIEEAYGHSNPAVSVTESSFDGNLDSANSGGLVNMAYATDVLVSKSYYKGIQSNISIGNGGGLVGGSQGATANITIADSYAASNLTALDGSSLIAGFLSFAHGHVTINRSYYAGSVAGPSPKACIGYVGSAASVAVSDVYYNSAMCSANASTTGTITGVIGMTTPTLQSATPFANWLTSVWVFTSGQNPKLIWE